MDDMAEGEESLLVHALWGAPAKLAGEARRARFHAHASTLGLTAYEFLDTRRKPLANLAIRRMRGTRPAPDAVELLTLRHGAPSPGSVIAAWRAAACCKADGFDATRSFLLWGYPVRRVGAGPASGARLLWFGQGLSHLTRDEFATHYVQAHGPLVASHAEQVGLRSYRQLRSDGALDAQALHAAGLGRAEPTPVFAELCMGVPRQVGGGLVERRRVMRTIASDEQRHIDFGRSMLVLT